MNKIIIIGCCGAGKTYLSVALGNRLNIPVHHLDKMYWKPNWVESDMQEFQSKQDKIFDESQWIIDGNYGKTMDARIKHADTIIFLDLPTHTCLISIIKRFFKFKNKTRPDMGGENNEQLTFEFLLYALSFKKTHRPKIIRKLENIDQNKTVIFLNSRENVNSFINKDLS